MKKYLRAMIKGSPKTKLYLWTIAAVLILSILCFGGCILGMGMGFAYAAFGGVIFSIAYSQLAVFRDVNVQIDQMDKLEQSIQRKEKMQKNSNKKRKRSPEEDGEIDDNELNKYTSDTLKHYFHEYKVKKENYCVLIDSSEKYHIKKCPAYVWSDKHYLFFLLLEKKARIIHIPRKDVAILRYEKGIVIKDIDEYKKVKDSVFLSEKFQYLYPKYYKQSINGLTTFVKNVFVIGEDIRVTAPSAYGLIQAVGCRLELTDKQFDRSRYGGYFEEIYKSNLLLKEEAIDQEKYDELLRGYMVDLAEHEEKIEVFQDILCQLRQYKMITQEYAEFYMNYRNKLEEKRRKGKR